MDMKNSENQTSLIFAINGDKFELSNIDPSTTLLEFLRTQTRFKSVKLGCGEGIIIIIIHNLAYICLYKLTV
jgi:abscisic-aldehyde oxidase